MTKHSVTPSVGQIPAHNQYLKENEPKRVRFEKWFYAPLRRMSKHDGFAIITLLFPLYERHLRLKFSMDETAKFTEGSAGLKEIALDLSIPENKAGDFWDIFRNGAMHYGQPKYNYILIYHHTNPIEIINNIYNINPLELRDLLLKKFNNNMWASLNIPDSYISVD
ncbi:MAG: hypothetical protein SH818_19405 [Saprospiraceae bacterium]|nr:hypothetical protein [Saprospiraceae bacterium]